MSGVKRIPTTERHAELREAVASVIATADGYKPSADPEMWNIMRHRYLALADAAIERVVEGLVATIKALPQHDAGHETYSARPIPAVRLTDVLAVVEAAREDTT